MDLSKSYRKHYSSTYRSSNATRCFMQLPVVVLKASQKPGMQKLYVIEKQDAVDYEKLVKIVLKFSLEKTWTHKA